MYLNQYSKYVQREVSKENKIFRPWDSEETINKYKPHVTLESFDDYAQDATISTTTDNDLINDQLEITKCDVKDPSTLKECERDIKKLQNTEHELQFRLDSTEKIVHLSQPSLIDYCGNSERLPIYPDIMNVHLAQSLGLTPTDPLLLECISQGYSVEEYSRVISQEQQAKILSSRKQRPKKYRCPHCEVGFSNNGQLKGHIRIHTGERPFRCDESNCGKTFTRNEELTRHKRIHSGLRPFPCTHCGKRFGRKDHLKKHSRTHFQTQGLYAVPVMLPFETWTSPAYPYLPMFTY